MEHHIPEENTMACHLTSMEEEDEEEKDAEEHFTIVSMGNNVWMEEPVPEKHLWFLKIQNMTCALTLAHTVGISYTLLKMMHHSTWTSVKSLSSPMS